MTIRVVIADDHALWRAGLAQLLEAEGLEVAAQAATGDEALDAVRDNPGAVLLLDISMPGRLDGLATTARLKERGDDVKVIIVSGRDDRDALFSSITAGARGYIAKDADPAQLIGAIHLVAGGGSAFGGSVTEGLAGGVTGLDYAPGEYERRRLDLSERELQVLRLLATPMTAAQIASHLFLSTKTVQNHVSSIYRKLSVRSRSEAVVKGIELHFISGGSS
jgi:DNA-binding NarL/FixJ family response regulator